MSMQTFESTKSQRHSPSSNG